MKDFGKNGIGKHTNNAEITNMNYQDNVMEDTDYSMEYDAHKRAVSSSDMSKVRKNKLNEMRQP